MSDGKGDRGSDPKPEPDSEPDSGTGSAARVAADLVREAGRADERRLLVLSGGRDAGIRAAGDALAAAEIGPDGVSFVSTLTGDGDAADAVHPSWERLPPANADRLLGRTRRAVVLDAHDDCRPNAIGRAVGAVDGGGLLVLVTPPVSDWPARRDAFDRSLAVPPFDIDAVGGRFRARLVETLRDHPGVAIVTVGDGGDGDRVERDGRTGASKRSDRPPPTAPPNAAFPARAYEVCLTRDQARAVAGFERLRDPGTAVIVEADRGRGKSSAAGIAAGALAADGHAVLVTAPASRNARELLARAGEFLGVEDDFSGGDSRSGGSPVDVETAAGGSIRFRPPATAVRMAADADVVLVDEAAALPVATLTDLAAAPAIGFCTTVHGYEGAGRGFTVRFRDRLADSSFSVRTVELTDPIRYAPDDPLETWSFRALLLDARPAVEPAVADATPAMTEYRRLGSDELSADETLLREAFGLLVAAHYRTEPTDLARLLDAPNLRVRALVHNDRVVAIALLAREGGLPAALRQQMYEGSRVRGNMLPDVLTSQLRDETAGIPIGYRVVRIATHHAVRDRGLGSRLLREIHAELGGSMEGSAAAKSITPPEPAEPSEPPEPADWFGVGYGATPQLLRFWRRAGYRTVHLSTTRNDASGEYSAVMLRPATQAGSDLAARHGEFFIRRIRDVLSDALRDLEPDVARGALAACEVEPAVDLSDHGWRVVAAAAFGPGLYDADPGAFRDLALRALVDGAADLSARHERLLVAKVLQGRPWEAVADDLGYASTSECMRDLGAAFRPIVDAHGGPAAREERDRYG